MRGRRLFPGSPFLVSPDNLWAMKAVVLYVQGRGFNSCSDNMINFQLTEHLDCYYSKDQRSVSLDFDLNIWCRARKVKSYPNFCDFVRRNWGNIYLLKLLQKKKALDLSSPHLYPQRKRHKRRAKRNAFSLPVALSFLFLSEVKTYNPAADSTIETPGKKRKRSEQNGDSTPAPSVPDTPVTPATEEGLCTIIKQFRPQIRNPFGQRHGSP